MPAFSWLGIIGFAVICFVFDGSSDATIAGAAAGLLGVTMIVGQQSSFSKIVLGNPIFFWLGQRSYVIYLVHWPLIVLYKQATGGEIDLTEQAVLAIASLALGEVLHRLVESPFRIRESKDRWIDKYAFGATTAVVVCSVFLSANIWGYRGFQGRAADEIVDVVGKIPDMERARSIGVRSGTCHMGRNQNFENYDLAQCATVNPKAYNVLILGNSHAADAYMLLSRRFNKINFLQATAPGCPLSEAKMPEFEMCEKMNELRLGQLLESGVDEVLLSTGWGDEEIADLPELINLIKTRSGARVTVFGKKARFRRAVPLLLEQYAKLNGFDEFASRDVELFADVNATLAKIAEENRADFYDFAQLQCGPVCHVLEGSNLLYVDALHMSPAGAEYFAVQLSKQRPEFIKRWRRGKRN